MNLDAATYEYPTLARQPKATYQRKPYDPKQTAARILQIIKEHGKARMKLHNGKPVACRVDSKTGGRLIQEYDGTATAERIERDAADAYGWMA